MIRRVVFWFHLSVAVAAGAVILMMALTGALLSLRTPVVELAERRHFLELPGQGGAEFAGEAMAVRLGPREIVAAAERALVDEGRGTPDADGTHFTAASLRYRSDGRAPVRVLAGRDRYLDLDPWTGAVVAAGPGRAERFFEAVEGWHRWFNLSGGSVRRARAVTGAANLAFLALLLTGPILWWPRSRSRKSLGRALRLRRGARGAARELNWHQVVGIWSVLPLAVIVATGVATSYPAVGDRVNPVVGRVVAGGGWPGVVGVVGAERGGTGLSGVLATAMSWAPGWQTLTLTLPRPGDEAVRVEVRGAGEGQPHRIGYLTVDARTAAARGWEVFADETPGRRGQQFLRYAHTGEYWGVAGGWVAGAFSLAAALMVWTGFSLAVRRAARIFRSRRKPRCTQATRPRPESPAGSSSGRRRSSRSG